MMKGESSGAVTSWTGRDHTETSLLAALVELVVQRGDAVVLTWGGSSADVVRLTMLQWPSSRWTAPSVSCRPARCLTSAAQDAIPPIARGNGHLSWSGPTLLA